MRSLLDRQIANQPAANENTTAHASPARLPATSNGDNVSQVPAQPVIAAKDIAAAIDLRTLRKAIADAIITGGRDHRLATQTPRMVTEWVNDPSDIMMVVCPCL